MLAVDPARREATLSETDVPHRSVLVEEVLRLLDPAPDALVVDATLGPGGHAEALLRRLGPNGRLIGIDRDPAALALARARLAGFGDRFAALHGDHRDVAMILARAGAPAADAIVADLGISSAQLDDPSRGFSFSADGPLDMRMDPGSGLPSAAELIAALDETQLRDLIATWGEDRNAFRIARAIVRARSSEPILTTGQLRTVVESAAGPAARRFRIHPATRTFQALRIAVNREVEGIRELVTGAVERLRAGGRLAVIAFHSLEDREVKTAMHDLAHRCVCPPGLPVCGCGRTNLVRLITSGAIVPSDDEVAFNPRARSARLRAVEKLP